MLESSCLYKQNLLKFNLLKAKDYRFVEYNITSNFAGAVMTF